VRGVVEGSWTQDRVTSTQGGRLCRPTVRSRRPVGSLGTPTHGTRASWGFFPPLIEPPRVPPACADASGLRCLPMPVLVIGVAIVAVGFNLHRACCRYSDVEAGVGYELRSEQLVAIAHKCRAQPFCTR